MGAAEVWAALITSRPYQDKLSPERALQRMGELVGTVLDPAVYAALESAGKRRRSLVFLVDGKEMPQEVREWEGERS